MSDKIIDILTKIPKDILIHCAELLIFKRKMADSIRECVKVANLRKKYGSDANFEKWLEDSNNVYCGRLGRIFVNGKYFGYEGSKWANPYTIKKYSLDECLVLYQKYITEKIEKDPKEFDLNELKAKNLGCWCNLKDRCHVDVLLALLADSDS